MGEGHVGVPRRFEIPYSLEDVYASNSGDNGAASGGGTWLRRGNLVIRGKTRRPEVKLAAIGPWWLFGRQESGVRTEVTACRGLGPGAAWPRIRTNTWLVKTDNQPSTKTFDANPIVPVPNPTPSLPKLHTRSHPYHHLPLRAVTRFT